MIQHSAISVGRKEMQAVNKVLESQHISEGAQVKSFEHTIARYLRLPYAAAVSSGTHALHCALMAMGIQSGDQVIIPSYCCASVFYAVMYTGAEPIIADISLNDYNLSFKNVKKRINRKTKAIILPHMFGCPADMHLFLKAPVPVIEDCAQAVGAKLYAKMAGGFGIVSVFSFYATKLMTCGEGGMVASHNRRYIDKVKDLRSCDKRKDLHLRFNYKMTDFQAAMGQVQLSRLRGFIHKRQRIAAFYTQAFKELKTLILPKKHEQREHVFFRYIIRTDKNIETCIAQYRAAGIKAVKPIEIPLHRMLRLSPADYPHAESAWKESISIPIYPALRDQDVKKIIQTTEIIFGE
ncbi:MAG: DegT/DnrJ/EryC1/StrS family aminotransferase [bacterium]